MTYVLWVAALARRGIDKPPAGEKKMSDDRVATVLDAYFKQPYEEYGQLALEIRQSGGLTPEEASLIESKVLCVDAKTIIRHSGPQDRGTQPQASATSNSCA